MYVVDEVLDEMLPFYHCWIFPGSVESIVSFAQNRPEMPCRSSSAKWTGMIAPSMSAFGAGPLPYRTSQGQVSCRGRYPEGERKARGTRQTHIGLHPSRATAVDEHLRVLGREDGGERVEEGFGDVVGGLVGERAGVLFD